MITRDAADRSVALSETQQVSRETGSLLSKKIWLPKLIYAAIPYFYLVSGLAALIVPRSKNGVFVNSKRVTEHFLKNGDVVTVGTTEFRYEERSKRDA